MKLKKILISTLICIALSNCYLHQATIAGDFYGFKLMMNPQKELNNPFPVEIEFDSEKQNEKINNYLKGKNNNKHISENFISNYCSNQIITNFEESKSFIIKENANIKIKIETLLQEVNIDIMSFIFSLMTLGIAPSVTQTKGQIEFKIYDSEKNKILKTYNYKITHFQRFGMTSMIYGSIYSSINDGFDHTNSEQSIVIMKVSFNQFSNDLLKDIKNDKNLFSRFK
ncbi:MAG: hypothetical protein KDK36_03525 [Leptospiraceae bacterium]|nr:hypothetical protein [Leptospiraceae bacterium]